MHNLTTKAMKKHHLFLTICTFLTIIGCNNTDRPIIQIDHIILAVNDLDSGIEQFEKLTGIKAEYGGGHPNSYTHNAIVALDGMAYIEILAPKKELDTVPEFFKNLNQLKPIGFALSTNEIEFLEKTVQDAHFKTNGIEDWSRTKPNGDKLKWKLLQIQAPSIDINPFFIDWSEESGHPSFQTNANCSLLEFKLTTPYKNEIETILTGNGAKIKILKMKDGDTVQLRLAIKTPKGKILFK